MIARGLRAAALAALAFGAPGCDPDAPAVRNVIVIVMDTTRADHCSVTGGTNETTPNLVRLAAKGAAFTDCWSPAGWTAPAHGSLFTGLLPAGHGLELDTGMFLLQHVPTLAERLGAAGWATAGFSNNEMVGDLTGLSRGFERFDPLYKRFSPAVQNCDATHDLAVEWALSKHSEGRPFFLFINDMEPHLPYRPPPGSELQFLPDARPEELRLGRAFDFPLTIDVMLGRTDPGKRGYEVLRALYDAEIASLDASIGTMLDRLEAAGALERTMVVVTSDHGENLGDHGLVDHRFSLHRSVCRVPLVVRVPGRLDDGRTVKEVVRLEDVFPTVLEACGLPPLRGIDGRSLLGELGGRISVGRHGRPDVFSERVRRDFPQRDLKRFDVSLQAVYDGRFHLITFSDGREELYDVSADPQESKNLAAVDRANVARLRALIR